MRKGNVIRPSVALMLVVLALGLVISSPLAGLASAQDSPVPSVEITAPGEDKPGDGFSPPSLPGNIWVYVGVGLLFIAYVMSAGRGRGRRGAGMGGGGNSCPNCQSELVVAPVPRNRWRGGKVQEQRCTQCGWHN